MYRLHCNNAGCKKECEPVLDVATNEVHCTECGKVMEVNHFTKVSMRSIGQIQRLEKLQQAFSVKCNFCKKETAPTVKNDKVYCTVCNNHLDYIAKPFVQAIKTNLSSQRKF